MTEFAEMLYERPDIPALEAEYDRLTEALKAAASYEEAKKVFLEKDQMDRKVQTQATLAQIRHSINTKDTFYEEEKKFWNAAIPQLQEKDQIWTDLMLTSPYRREFAEEYGDLLFVNAEISMKAFSPEIIPYLQKENDLTREYETMLACAQIPFEGKTYTISQMETFKKDADDDRRLAAWKAEGQWYKDNLEKLDGIYDELVHLRDQMAKTMGYEDFRTLGYYRMTRNCYTREDVEKFRLAVQKYLVPVAESIYKEQAKRLGKTYPMSMADNALAFRSGNPAPVGGPEEILAHGRVFYDELSPQTSEFFRTMLEGNLLDVVSRDGKEGGGYCTGIPDYKVPFIFANFNKTQHDVEVVTHEAGHAFAYYMNRDRVPMDASWPSMEACEVHSMSMEFFAWPWAEGFFGNDTRKFYYNHLAGALTFIPYGTMVDHFQHIVYEKPEMTPEERNQVWKELLGIYMPWHRQDGEIPYYSEGKGWQRQHHIYSMPFYYIDYCLAQTVALQFWAHMTENRKTAWEQYMKYTLQGGSRTFTGLLEHAGLESPFGEACLKEVCEKAKTWLEEFDLTGIL